MAASSSKPSPCHDEEIIHSFEELDLNFGSFTPQDILNIIRLSARSSFENMGEEKENEKEKEKEKSNEFVKMAKTQKGSVELLKRIVYEDPMQWQEILDGILECILEVMTDKYGHHLFLMVLERCDLCQFQTIIDTLELDEDLLIDASLPKHGSIAVQGFIKKLKLTGLAHSITSLLSKRFVELMTSEHGIYVVLQCIYTFGAKENEVLFSCAMRHFKELATTEYGCSSLFDFLKLICGFQRKQLLQNIADESNFLVNDRWGTIVLKKVLTFNDNEAIHKICDRLKMEFINLCSREGADGCQVVLKCLGASEYGTKCVLESLLQGSEEALLKLASDRFGTFVIQTALFKARSFDIKLYKLLVAILKPHFLALSSNENGRLVNLVIKCCEAAARSHRQFNFEKEASHV